MKDEEKNKEVRIKKGEQEGVGAVREPPERRYLQGWEGWTGYFGNRISKIGASL